MKKKECRKLPNVCKCAPVPMLLAATLITAALSPVVPLAEAQHREHATSAPSASAGTQVTVSIPVRASVKVTRQPSTITVTGRDLKRGYAIIPGAFTFVLWCNSPDGVKVVLTWDGVLTDDSGVDHPVPAFFYRVSGESAFKSPESSPNAIYIADQKVNSEEISVDIKIALKSGIRPGFYRLDSDLSAEPITSSGTYLASMREGNFKIQLEGNDH